MDRRRFGRHSPVVRGGIYSLLSLHVAAFQIVPALSGIRPEKSPSHLEPFKEFHGNGRILEEH